MDLGNGRRHAAPGRPLLRSDRHAREGGTALAALLAILSALRRAVLRKLGTFGSIRVNNFFLFVALLIYAAVISGMPPKAAEPFVVLLCLLLLFPMSSDPLALIPPERLASWPLHRWQRPALRIGSLALSPVIWLVALILWKTASLSLAAVVLALAVGAQFLKVRKGSPLRLVPRIPGRLGGLIRLSLRETLSVLDVYLALVLSLSATAYRLFAGHPNPAAFPILALLVGLALSTYAQSLFGLDLGSGMTRYRLLPLRGWEILLAKDAAYLAILFVLVLPLSPVAGLTFGSAALTIGHHTSVFTPMPQHRWRFVGGRVAFGGLQAIAGVILGFAAQQRGLWVLGLTGLVWCASLFWYGRCWDRSTGTSS